MRSIFEQKVKDDRITIAEGYFDATGVEDGWADLVVIAQVIHLVSCNITDYNCQPGIPLVPRLQ